MEKKLSWKVMETEKSWKKVMEKSWNLLGVATLDSNVHGKELSQIILVPKKSPFFISLTKCKKNGDLSRRNCGH